MQSSVYQGEQTSIELFNSMVWRGLAQILN